MRADRGNRGAMIVTGSSRGIGAAIAKRAATSGYGVCVNYKERRDSADAVVAAIREAGGTACAFRADVGVEAEIVSLFRAVDDELGKLTALVNNAGILGWEDRLEAASGERLTQLWATNITSFVLCSREAVRRMSTRTNGSGGAIVNISSMAGKNGASAGRIHYGTTKGAMNAFTKGLARETAREGIRVNAVLPGYTDTDFHLPHGGQERIARLAPAIPLGRAATAEEVASAAMWLLSDEASYVTGALLEVAGGV